MIARSPCLDGQKDLQDSTVSSILLLGAPGEGISLAADILAETALFAGFHPQTMESHPTDSEECVCCEVQIGSRGYSPNPGRVDLLVALNPEALRNQLYRLAPDGMALAVEESRLKFPSDPRVLWVRSDASLDLQRWGRRLHLLMLGVASWRLPFSTEDWSASMESQLPRKLLGTAREAFRAGRKLTLDQRALRVQAFSGSRRGNS
ncbi:MAG: 2-oxoacid:acceptor oxidoreductase family protein [Planctomycetales bacterium]